MVWNSTFDLADKSSSPAASLRVSLLTCASVRQPASLPNCSHGANSEVCEETINNRSDCSNSIRFSSVRLPPRSSSTRFLFLAKPDIACNLIRRNSSVNGYFFLNREVMAGSASANHLPSPSGQTGSLKTWSPTNWSKWSYNELRKTDFPE